MTVVVPRPSSRVDGPVLLMSMQQGGRVVEPCVISSGLSDVLALVYLLVSSSWQTSK